MTTTGDVREARWPGTGPSVGRARFVLARFRRRPTAVAGLVTLVLFYLVSFTSPLFAPWAYDQYDLTALLQPPSVHHWFGTTQIGEDVFAQTMRGLRRSLTIALLTAVLSTAIAAVVGAAAGYFGGLVDRVLIWVVDLMLVLPALLVVAVLSPAVRRSSWLVLVLLLALFGWMVMARAVRGSAAHLRESAFVQAAEFMGARGFTVIRRHVLPNLAALLVIEVTITVGSVVLLETGLSYFGFGVQPPDVSLGTLIRAGSDAALTTPWLIGFAGGLVVVAVLAVNAIGDGLVDALAAGPARRRPGVRTAAGSEREHRD